MTIDVVDLKKISKEPVAKLMANAGLKLETDLGLPTVAGVGEYLTALDRQAAHIDILKLLSVALPPREAVWWACLAAEDIAGASGKKEPPALAAAKAWVYKPDDENREAVQVAMQNADFDDGTVLCALAAYYADGSVGTGDLKEHPAPPGSVPASVLAQNVSALDVHGDDVEATFDLMIRRALDIARGGNGKSESLSPGNTEEVE